MNGTNGDIITDRAKFAEGWRGGLPETPCGGGSTISRTARQRAWIPRIVREYGIRTIANVGAGDLNWWDLMALDVETVHLDLVPRRENVRQFDIVAEVPPAVDLIVCTWVLNHLRASEADKAMENMKASGSRYLLVTPEVPIIALGRLSLDGGIQMILAEL